MRKEGKVTFTRFSFLMVLIPIFGASYAPSKAEGINALAVGSGFLTDPLQTFLPVGGG